MRKLTLDRLREVLSYDHETGIFTWLKFKAGVRCGSRAGYLGTSGYRRIRIDGEEYKSSRLAWLYMTDEWPKNLIDHINTDKSDDRFSNLREATVSQNGANRLAQRNNRIGIKGVRLSKTGKRFEVSIKMHPTNQMIQ